MPQNSRSWELAPRIALRLGLACIPGVTKILQENNRLLFRRSLFQGKLLADLAVETRGVVLTFESGYFKFSGSPLQEKGFWELNTLSPSESRAELLEITPALEIEADLREAEVIVAAGRGIGSEETLDLIHRLAALFPRSSVAGSRPYATWAGCPTIDRWARPGPPSAPGFIWPAAFRAPISTSPA